MVIAKQNSIYFILCLLSLLYVTSAYSQVSEATRINLGPDGEEANLASSDVSISEDGKVVAFSSDASNLVSNDTNEVADAFVYNAVDGTITRISESTLGVEGDGPSGVSVTNGRSIYVSPNGLFVTFLSQATNLTPIDMNQSTDVFVFNIIDKILARASLVASSLEPDSDCLGPSVSNDGNLVAFSSASGDFSTTDQNFLPDIFLRDVANFNSFAISVVPDGSTSLMRTSFNSMISADGRYVVFSSSADDLVSNDTNDVVDIFIRDIQQSTTKRISVSSEEEEGNGDSVGAYISSDGRYIVFESYATNLVTGDDNDVLDVFIHDQILNTTEIASLSNSDKNGNAMSGVASLSNDGRYVAFLSDATNLVKGDTNDEPDAFVRDRLSERTFRVNLRQDGSQSVIGTEEVVISGDGNTVAFITLDDEIISDDTNEAPDIFLSTLNPILTPDTEITEAPTVEVLGDDVTIVMEKFSGATNNTISSFGISKHRQEQAGTKRRKKLVVRYKVKVTGTDDLAGFLRRRTVKRNTLTFRNLPAGSYTTSYKVLIKRGDRVISSTNRSPSASFSVSE